MHCTCVPFTPYGPHQWWVVVADKTQTMTCNCNCDVHRMHSSDWYCDGTCIFMNLAYKFKHVLSPAHSDCSVKLGFFPEWNENSTYFGIEIELICEDIDNLLEKWETHDVRKHYVVSLEASVDSCLEFISAPMTYDEHCKHLPTLFRFFEQFKLTMVENTGMHFHISRNEFTMARTLEYVDYLTDETNWAEIDVFAGRPANAHCNRQLKDKVLDNKCNAVRYTPNTVEIRIFKATTDLNTARSRLDTLRKLFSPESH
jgi:hypothetical protein